MRLLLSIVLAVSLSLLAGPVAAEVSRGPEPGLGSAPVRQGAWPLAPRPEVVRGFDPPATRFGAGHRGVDLAGHPGQPVRSALPGTITFAGTLAGRGVVVVDHGATRTTYEPVAASVRVGDHVGRGARIGTLQRASSHCFPRACLHWGLLRGEVYLDPLTLVGGGPIRLLPLTGIPGSLAAPRQRAPSVTMSGGAMAVAAPVGALPVAQPRIRVPPGALRPV